MKAYFENYGCSLIIGETDMMRQMALDKGWELVDEVDGADLVVISTCVVVQATEAKMSNRIKALSRNGRPMVVFGCMASTMADKVRRLAPAATLLPPHKLKGFEALLDIQGTPTGKISERSLGPEVHMNVPIANGCRGNCTFCITRLARGELRSRPVQEIEGHVRRELTTGRREVRLTAQDTALYGQDLGPDGKGGLPDLVDRISALDGEFRIRIGMMNPNSLVPVVDRLLSSYKSPKVFGFLHLPAQSGSDAVLERMVRGYTTKEFRRAVKRFREGCPGLYLSTDIIAGFPGETEEEFRASIELMEDVRPDIVNIKGFSARPGTEAKSMPGRVDTKVVKQRTRELTVIKKRITKENLERLVGTECEVLLTERPKPGTTMGRTPHYRPIAVKGELPLGEFVQVRVTGSRHSYLLGKRI
jgi:MiaB-like tRNA modifying enzyme